MNKPFRSVLEHCRLELQGLIRIKELFGGLARKPWMIERLLVYSSKTHAVAWR
jgi:hypothetical protein